MRPDGYLMQPAVEQRLIMQNNEFSRWSTTRANVSRCNTYNS